MIEKNILKKILDFKKVEIEKRRSFIPLRTFIQKIPKETRDFKKALEGNKISLIAEIKRMSPSSGIIMENLDPIAIAREYESSGASAISIITDAKFFWGKDSDIPLVKGGVGLPILRKDFIIDEYQIYESAYLGADAILLIARILELEQLKKFIQLAKDLGLYPLVEIHKKEELQKVFSTEAEIIGINNRDLETFKTSIDNSINLKKFIPEKYITVSESGIKKREDVQILEEAGFNAILVGETLLREREPGEKIKELLGR
ncbi:MAG: indole-3-glycerol phosphate synthase TrpC [candidate division WOR-3 bacterium]